MDHYSTKTPKQPPGAGIDAPHLWQETGGLTNQTVGDEKEIAPPCMQVQPIIGHDLRIERFKAALMGMVRRAEHDTRHVDGDPTWTEYELQKRNLKKSVSDHINYEQGIHRVCKSLKV